MKTKTLKLFSGLVCALALAVPQHSAQAAGTKTITFASGTNWRAYKSDPASGPARSLGFAQAVCVNTRIPSPCPENALNYGYEPVEFGWTADRSSIPGALWVWAPKITAATTPAELDQYYFSKKFNVKGDVLAAAVSVAVTDFAEVIVNGVVVGHYGSVEDISQAAHAQMELAVFDIAPYLVKGTNTITIHAQNGPGYFSALYCGPCTYNQKPAGVVFGGKITYSRRSSSTQIETLGDDNTE
jgi:hypothetical protein